MSSFADQPECWPALPLDEWKETYATLHMWTQIVGSSAAPYAAREPLVECSVIRDGSWPEHVANSVWRTIV